MADVGRLDAALGLRRLLEVSGDYEPEIGEGIVPTVIVHDMTSTPFSMALPWSRAFGVGAVAAQTSWAVVVPGAALPEHSWIEINKIWVSSSATGAAIWIDPMALADVPALGSTVVAISNRQNEAIRRDFPEVSFRVGNSATAGPKLGLFKENATIESLVVEGEWAISQLGALAITTSAVNVAMNVAIMGRLHYTTTS